MKSKLTQPTPPTTNNDLPTESSSELQERIRRRAYQLYEERGREAGRDFDDWLQAESEITAKKASTAAA